MASNGVVQSDTGDKDTSLFPFYMSGPFRELFYGSIMPIANRLGMNASQYIKAAIDEKLEAEQKAKAKATK